MDQARVEKKVSELLDEFYKRRLLKIEELQLQHVLKRKNPYLFKAIGVRDASEIVGSILTAFMSSSEEGMFGDAFFEPLAKFVSEGQASPSDGVDIAKESAHTYQAIAVKSGVSVFNSQSRKKQAQDFKALENRIRKLKKHFDPIVGYCYGKKRQKLGESAFRELAGQDFWREITGDADFYLKIIRLMKDKPRKHAVQYQTAFANAQNRFVREFTSDYCNADGSINWEKLLQFNSGCDEKPKKEKRKK